MQLNSTSGVSPSSCWTTADAQCVYNITVSLPPIISNINVTTTNDTATTKSTSSSNSNVVGSSPTQQPTGGMGDGGSSEVNTAGLQKTAEASPGEVQQPLPVAETSAKTGKNYLLLLIIGIVTLLILIFMLVIRRKLVRKAKYAANSNNKKNGKSNNK